MAVTLTHTQLDVTPTYAGVTPVLHWEATFNPGNPYATGGVVVNPAAINAALTLAGVGATVATIQNVVLGESTNGQVTYVYTGGLVLAFNAAKVEIANGTDLSAAGYTAYIKVVAV
jgi:hypothetical protein